MPIPIKVAGRAHVTLTVSKPFPSKTLFYDRGVVILFFIYFYVTRHNLVVFFNHMHNIELWSISLLLQCLVFSILYKK
jgi:hypothetical protein